MVNFKSKTEGEKFTFSKDFVLRLRVIKSLKPELTEADAIRFVAHKFYGDDVVGVADIIDFIEDKCGTGVDLTNAPLDQKKDEYINSLTDEVKNKEKERKLKEKQVQDKLQALDKEKSERKEQEKEALKSYKKVRNSSILYYALLVGGVLAGLALIASFGGVAGTIYAAVGAISNISFTQLLSLGLLIGAGKYVWNYFKGKRKEKPKKTKRFDRLKEEYSKNQEAMQKSKEKVDSLTKELAAAQAEVNSASKEEEAIVLKKSAEEAHLASYRTTTDFGRRVDFAATFIKADYEQTKAKLDQNGASNQDKKNLDDWYNHFIGSIYYGASKGTIKTVQDIEQIEQEARDKFALIKDPLNVVDMTYNNVNVNSGTNNKTNQTLDDMYASL